MDLPKQHLDKGGVTRPRASMGAEPPAPAKAQPWSGCGDRDRHRDKDAHGDRHGDQDSLGEGNGDSHGDIYGNGHSEGDRHEDSHRDSHRDGNSHQDDHRDVCCGTHLCHLWGQIAHRYCHYSTKAEILNLQKQK